MKKILFALIIALSLCTIARADDAVFSTAFNNGGTWVEQSTFGLSQKPWLHISVPDTSFFQDWTTSFWNYPSPGSSTFLSNPFSAFAEYQKVGTSDIYLTFNDPVWDAIKKPGEWNISAATTLFKSSGAPYYWTTLQAYSGSTAFSVTPEPISSTLFVLGAGALAARAFRRKK